MKASGVAIRYWLSSSLGQVFQQHGLPAGAKYCLGSGSLVCSGSGWGLPSLLYVTGDSSPVTTVLFTPDSTPHPPCPIPHTHHSLRFLTFGELLRPSMDHGLQSLSLNPGSPLGRHGQVTPATFSSNAE